MDIYDIILCTLQPKGRREFKVGFFFKNKYINLVVKPLDIL